MRCRFERHVVVDVITGVLSCNGGYDAMQWRERVSEAWTGRHG